MINYITEISEKDFKKLNLYGFDRKMVDRADGSKSLKFIKKSLNEVIDENKDFCKENKWNTIAIAVHIEPTEDEIIEQMKDDNLPTIRLAKNDEEKYEEARSLVLNDYSYYDKWLNRMGASTYLVGCGIKHLYSTRDYFEIKDDYWKVKKRETEAIYIVHLED